MNEILIALDEKLSTCWGKWKYTNDDDDDDDDDELLSRNGWPAKGIRLISSWDQCQILTITNLWHPDTLKTCAKPEFSLC